MKRNLARVLVLAAAMAAGATAFAQVTINGYYRVGGLENINSNQAGAATFLDRIQLNLSYAAPDDMFGFKSRLQADSSTVTSTSITTKTGTSGSTSTSTYSGIQNLFLNTVGTGTDSKNTVIGLPPATLKYAMGYVKFFDGMAKVSVGYLDVTDYSVKQNIANPYLGDVYLDNVQIANKPLLDGQKGNTKGFILQLFPIEGLSVAGVMQLDTNNLQTSLHDFGVDAYYMIPDVGKVLISSQLGVSGASSGAYNAGNAAIIDDPSKSFVSAGFSYTGFPGLVASAAYRYTNSSYYNNAASGAIAIVEYTQGPLFADVAEDCDFTNSAYYTEGEISYQVIPQLKVRGYGACYSIGQFQNTLQKPNTTFVTANLGPVAYSMSTNQYLAGLDLVFPVGKGELDVGANIGDQSYLSFPIIAKVNF